MGRMVVSRLESEDDMRFGSKMGMLAVAIILILAMALPVVAANIQPSGVTAGTGGVKTKGGEIGQMSVSGTYMFRLVKQTGALTWAPLAAAAGTTTGDTGWTGSLTTGAGGTTATGTGGAGGLFGIYGGVGGAASGAGTGGAGAAVAIGGGAGGAAGTGGTGGAGGALTIYSGIGGTPTAGTIAASGTVTCKTGGASGTTAWDATATGAMRVPVVQTATITCAAGTTVLTSAYYGKTVFITGEAAQTITLPANGAAAGSWMEFVVIGSDNTIPTIAAATVDTLITANDAAADSVTFATGHRIGAALKFISTGTYWVAINEGSTTMSVTTN